jgi:hypothetical protein
MWKIIVIVLSTGATDVVTNNIETEELCWKILENTHVVKGIRYRCIKNGDE